MADVKISQLPVASSVADADIVVINQGGVTKTAVRSLVKNPGTVTIIQAGTGLSGGTITGAGTIAVNYGTTAGTAAQGNDARLSDARTPTAHATTHATGGSDALTPGDIGAVPTSRTVSAGTGLAGGGDLTADRTLSVSYGTTAGTAAQGNDARLSDSRTPTDHKSTHAIGGSDALSPADIGAAPIDSPALTGTPTSTTAAAGTSTTQVATTAFVQANRGDKYLATSTSTQTIGNGAMTFQTQANLAYIPTQDITIVANGSGSTNHMHGIVTSYSGTTLVVDISQHSGSGTFSNWTINVGGLTTVQGALLSANNLSDVSSASTSLTNIGGVSTGRTISAGTGLTGGGDLSADRSFAVTYGTTAGTAAQGNDSRLSDSRTPTAHASTHAAAGSDPITITSTQISGSLTQNTSGTAAGLSSTLAVASGGTGQTTYTDGQLLIGNTATGGLSKATLTAGTNVTITNGNGTITIASTGGGGSTGVSSFSAGTTGLTPSTGSTGDVTLAGTLAIANGGTGATSTEAARVAMGGIQQIDWSQTSTVVGTYNTGAGTLTYTANGTLSFDGATPSVGDTVYLSGQGATSTPTSIANGPWVVTDVGSAGTPGILTRPSWFSGTIQNTPLYAIKYGNNNTGVIRAIVGPTGTTKTGFTVGTSVLTSVTVGSRSSNVSVGGATMTGRLTLVGNTTTVNPLNFQAATALLTTPTANAMEWDGTSMFLTNTLNAAAVRHKVAFTDETITLIPTALSANSTYGYDVGTQQVVYWQTAATATNTLTLNARWSSTASLASVLAVGQSITIGALITSATLITTVALQIDGITAAGIKWQNGLSSGSVNSTDVYTFTITKTAATPTYTVFGSITKYV